MIQSFFDEKRRKALHDAIKDGKPLPIQARKPMEDVLGKNSTFDDDSHTDGGIDGGECDADGGIMDGGFDADVDGGPDWDGGLEGTNNADTEKFEGMLQPGMATIVGAYEFTLYRRQLPHKPESEDVIMEIRCGGAVVWEGELPQGVESEIEIPQDSKKVIISPSNLGTASAIMRISVGDK